MMFAVHFENDPGKREEQQRHDAAHRAYLREHAVRFVAAGSLVQSAQNVPASGGLWLLRATSELEVRELVEGDPLFVHGVRRTVRVWQFLPEHGVD